MRKKICFRERIIDYVGTLICKKKNKEEAKNEPLLNSYKIILFII